MRVGLLGVAGTAAAHAFDTQPKTRWCTGGDLVISAHCFNPPGQGSPGDSVTVARPPGLGAIVRVGDLMAPAG